MFGKRLRSRGSRLRFESLKPRNVLAVDVFSVDESQSITEVQAEVSSVASDADGGYVEAASEN